MAKKCIATGKVIFSSLLEAKAYLYFLKWKFYRRRDLYGKRIKHRQGRPAQKRAYICSFCHGYHLTRWEKRDFNTYLKQTKNW